MNENTLKEMLPKIGEYDKNYHVIKPIYDVTNNKIHYQTEPFVNENGEVVVKRLFSIDVKIEKINQIIEEYNMVTTPNTNG